VIFRRLHPTRKDEEENTTQVDSLSQLTRGFGYSPTAIFNKPKRLNQAPPSQQLRQLFDNDSGIPVQAITPLILNSAVKTPPGSRLSVETPATVVLSSSQVSLFPTPLPPPAEILIEERNRRSSIDCPPIRLAFDSGTPNKNGSTKQGATLETSVQMRLLENSAQKPLLENIMAETIEKSEPMLETVEKLEPIQETIPKLDDKDTCHPYDSPTRLKFTIGNTVTVARCMKPRVNRAGGIARVMKIHGDGTCDVKYILECRREKRISMSELTPGVDVASSALFGSGNEMQHEPPYKKPKLEVFESFVWKILFTGAFSVKLKEKLQVMVEELKGTVVDDPTIATHIVVQKDKHRNDVSVAKGRTLKYIRGVSRGLWVLDYRWIKTSALKHKWVVEDPFEITADSQSLHLGSGGPCKARQALEISRRCKGSSEGLVLYGCSVMFIGAFVSPFPSVPELNEIALLCGADLVYSIDSLEKSKKNVFIIGATAKSSRKHHSFNAIRNLCSKCPDIYHMVSTQWLLNSVSTYTAQSPDDYLLSA